MIQKKYFLDNNKMVACFTGPEDAGRRIDQYLSVRFTYYSRTGWQDNISSGLVSVNGHIVKPSYIIKNGDHLVFRLFEKEEPDVDTNYSIVYMDEQMAVVNKPGNLPVHPAGIYRTKSLLSLLEKNEGGKFYTVNRIDRETSGLVFFGRSSSMASLLATLFYKKQVKKKYIVYVYGSFPTYLEVKGYIGKHDTSKIMKKKKMYNDADEKENIQYCETSFEKIMEKNGISKVYAMPVTGRQHQIRASLDSYGFPLVGDKIYGTDENRFFIFVKNGYCEEIRDILQRQALHCESVSFHHPITGKYTEFFAQEPEDMKGIMQ